MKQIRGVRFRILTALAVAWLAGCGGASFSPGAPAATTLPEAKQSELLYVSDTETGSVYVFTYPGGVLKQTLAPFRDPGGECVDAKGDVFITNTGGQNIIEYAHGAVYPSATLNDQGYFPFGCAVDPTTGNLAVTNFSKGSSSGGGDVVIYAQAKGKIKQRISDPAIAGPLLCGYDDKGNLFIDGLTGSTAGYAELLKGSKKFTNLTLDTTIGSPGGVQWDGKYLAIGDETTDIVYQFSVSGKNATKKGSVQLKGGSAIVQFWIDGSRVAGANSSGGSAGIWKYPSGGSPLKTIKGVYIPLGVTISK